MRLPPGGHKAFAWRGTNSGPTGAPQGAFGRARTTTPRQPRKQNRIGVHAGRRQKRGFTVMKREWVFDKPSQSWVLAPGGVQPDFGNPLARWLINVARAVADRKRRAPVFRVVRHRSVWQEFPNPTGRYWLPFTADRWVARVGFYVFGKRVLTITSRRPFRGRNINAFDSAGWTGRRH